ncbi:V-type ATP synthase subunit D [Oryzihumus sp.]
MTGVRGIPPGRAGRVWLVRRLEAARRGADVLDRKLRILRREEDRCHARAERAGVRWVDAVTEAETWALRSALLAGSAALRPGYAGGGAEVRLVWSAVMGARFPGEAECLLPLPHPLTWLPASSAISCATDAYREALTAAVEAAVAQAASRVVGAELATTRTRARALEVRWVPTLQQALSSLELTLAEADAAEASRLRLVVEADRSLGPGDRTRRARGR